MPVGIVFKGSGFYATDHKSPSGQGRSSGSKSGDEEKKSEPSEKSSGENKPTDKKSD